MSHAMSNFQSLCSEFCFMVQQLLYLLFYLFRGFLLSDLYIFPCWKKLSFFSLPFCTVRCNMLPRNGEESLLPVTFLHWGYPEFWVVLHILGCMAAFSVSAVRIICSLVQKWLCSYLIVVLFLCQCHSANRKYREFSTQSAAYLQLPVSVWTWP